MTRPALNDEIVPLKDAEGERRFGGKAVNLCAALRSGLPVPNGFAISAAGANGAARGERHALAAVLAAYETFGGLVAVRSSAIGEDSKEASFAGQHLTVLGVLGGNALIEAVLAVVDSGRSEGASTYRRHMGVEETARVAVVVQRLVDPRAAGVLFTVNPVTGADERVVEAAWGLGEVVVGSLVTPDTVRVARGGACLDYRSGHKPIAIRRLAGGGTLTETLAPERAGARCLTDADLLSLDRLGDVCERVFAGPQDIEWAIDGEGLHLLQSRPVTRIATSVA